ncbi:MAG TPA: zf-HC2 domain-containing protein [Burkholderiaceae bacterium]|jgi:hypothetical protein
MIRLLPSCKEVTRLVLLSQETPLPLGKRVAVRAHWMICEACTNFRNQMRLMQKASARWRSYSEE